MRAVVATGAVAAAIGAIVALLPNPQPQPSAKLSHVSIHSNVTLREYDLRHGTETAWVPGAAPLLLAADVVAQTQSEEGTTTEGTTTEETTTEGTTTEGTTTEGTTTEGTTTEGTTTGEGEIVQEIPVSEEDRQRLNDGLNRAQSGPNPIVSQTDVGKACDDDLTDPDCGLTSIVTYLLSAHSEVSAGTVADRLVKFFEDVRRSEPPPRPVGPVGVAVDFNVFLTGFRGHRAEIRWSLWGKNGGQVPLDWYKPQRALLLKAKAQEVSASGEFWVPLPRRTPRITGPFFIEFGVYDEDGSRKDYWDTRPFP